MINVTAAEFKMKNHFKDNVATTATIATRAPVRDHIMITDQESPIQTFYKDKGVFLTGGTGFFGKIIIEKLLRVTEVAQIYLLIRPKKGKDVYTRMDDIFNDPVFARLKQCNPKYREKITLICGDCSQPALGISQGDRELLKEQVNIVIHGAATVRFDEKLKMAIAINVMGTKEMLKLAREIVNLKALVHVSTVFANCNHKFVEEKFYSGPLSGENALKLGECLDEHTLNVLTPTITKDYPNTYTFTKLLAENIVQSDAGNLPVTVFRPGIVITTYKEPVPGWIDNMYGPCGIIVGIASGVLRVFHGNVDNNAHIVPVDWTVNALLASAWDVARNTYDSPPIYNYVPDMSNMPTWREYIETGFKHGSTCAFRKLIWYPRFTVVSSQLQFYIMAFLYHTLPGLLMDSFMLITGRKPRMLKIYRKIHKFLSVMEYFCLNYFHFKNDNVHVLYDKLDATDKQLFEFDLRDMDWYSLYRISLEGLRLYVVKDDPSTLAEAGKRYERMKIIHYTTLFVLYSLLALVFYQIFKYFLLS